MLRPLPLGFQPSAFPGIPSCGIPISASLFGYARDESKPPLIKRGIENPGLILGNLETTDFRTNLWVNLAHPLLRRKPRFASYQETEEFVLADPNNLGKRT